MKGLIGCFAQRYIAGTHRAEAIEAARRLNGAGLRATIDNLGENVEDAGEALLTVKEYSSLLDDIKDSGVAATVSLKLTHLGLDISYGVARDNAAEIVKRALDLDNFVWFDMEGSAYTQRTIDIFLDVHGRHPNCGIAIQSCLLRSAGDVALLIKEQAAVRLVKGAYKEPPEISYALKRDVDKNYAALMRELLLKSAMPAIATHDRRLIDEAVRFASGNGIPKGSFEFQMLLGIKRGLQRSLAADGYRVTVYVPYGVNWLPYTLRRLRERKENIFFVLRNILD
ncbi:MAG: proline dehydrogenase family protein [Deltaproteobacteria bacterium]|nr:proline dehydrogenase family protein [Deltaproteobacteria bacterium]